jgi:hypothetical protein
MNLPKKYLSKWSIPWPFPSCALRLSSFLISFPSRLICLRSLRMYIQNRYDGIDWPWKRQRVNISEEIQCLTPFINSSVSHVESITIIEENDWDEILINSACRHPELNHYRSRDLSAPGRGLAVRNGISNRWDQIGLHPREYPEDSLSLWYRPRESYFADCSYIINVRLGFCERMLADLSSTAAEPNSQFHTTLVTDNLEIYLPIQKLLSIWEFICRSLGSSALPHLTLFLTLAWNVLTLSKGAKITRKIESPVFLGWQTNFWAILFGESSQMVKVSLWEER